MKGIDINYSHVRRDNDNIENRIENQTTQRDLIRQVMVRANSEIAAARKQASDERDKANQAIQDSISAKHTLKTAQQEIVVARKQALDERDKVNQAIQNSISTKHTIKSLQQGAEAARREGEAAGREAEAARRQAEAARRQAEASRREAEASRREAEASRREAEAARRNNEASRRETEAACREAEAARRETEAAHRETEAIRNAHALAVMKIEEQCRNLMAEDQNERGAGWRNYKTGVVITTHGEMGAYAQSCLGSLVTYIPMPRHIILYINEGTDPLFDTFEGKFPDVEIVRVDDQDAFGGLTGTWNAGIERCLAKDCDVVVLANGDTHVGADVFHLTDAAALNHRNEPRVFGPVSNAPGPKGCNICQLADSALAEAPREATIYVEKTDQTLYADLNGFFLCFPAHVLRDFRYDAKACFDLAYPWAQNETNWYRKHCPQLFQPLDRYDSTVCAPRLWVVPRCHVYHHKHAAWRKQSAEARVGELCLYTVVTGSYEAQPTWSPNETNTDVVCYYLSNDIHLLRAAGLLGWRPLFIGSWVSTFDTINHKAIQRSAKAAPCDVLPHEHKVSVYMDGNCEPADWSGNVQEFVKGYLTKDIDLVCWKHPDRYDVISEAHQVVNFKLETPDRVWAWMETIRDWGFADDQGLTETRLLIRRHHSLMEFSDLWRKSLEHCYRDQLIFDAAAWKTKVSLFRVPIPPYHGGVVRCQKHSGSGIHRRLVAWNADESKCCIDTSTAAPGLNVGDAGSTT